MHPKDKASQPLRTPAADWSRRRAAAFVSYKGVCIDFGLETAYSNTVSFRVLTPGLMQWHATQWPGLTSTSGGVLALQPSQM